MVRITHKPRVHLWSGGYAFLHYVGAAECCANFGALFCLCGAYRFVYRPEDVIPYEVSVRVADDNPLVTEACQAIRQGHTHWSLHRE